MNSKSFRAWTAGERFGSSFSRTSAQQSRSFSEVAFISSSTTDTRAKVGTRFLGPLVAVLGDAGQRHQRVVNLLDPPGTGDPG